MMQSTEFSDKSVKRDGLYIHETYNTTKLDIKININISNVVAWKLDVLEYVFIFSDGNFALESPFCWWKEN